MSEKKKVRRRSVRCGGVFSTVPEVLLLCGMLTGGITMMPRCTPAGKKSP